MSTCRHGVTVEHCFRCRLEVIERLVIELSQGAARDREWLREQIEQIHESILVKDVPG